MALFIPTYFSPISQYSEMMNADEIEFEMEDNFQKQSYRNRCYIYNSNGKQLLSIPVKHINKEGRKKTKDTLVENDFPWQDQHFKSLKSAYRTSPFFDFLEEEIAPIFNKKYKYLQDVNIDTFLFVKDTLQLEQSFKTTTSYQTESGSEDFRILADRKYQPKKIVDRYIQMFDDKHGFLPNLSILDLIFMEGPNALSYL
ncbi:WbqC family protein [Polaribacter dokdonensis]|uniref:WbqC-like protein family n=1 Tax=Polaribacter dokdonensis DSW-5 TaxID=1300348 RepID=A0A0M9CE07_9FLAO|nr:WbqC family protein [Polaribacter dokdonensis]KOY50523.1 WbqC-like protein family [Polaribacter dokdonensis DSW-5]SEE60177.1 WbqC-like protein family protein [Polaribacter dokdonensis DSW-5]